MAIAAADTHLYDGNSLDPALTLTGNGPIGVYPQKETIALEYAGELHIVGLPDGITRGVMPCPCAGVFGVSSDYSTGFMPDKNGQNVKVVDLGIGTTISQVSLSSLGLDQVLSMTANDTDDVFAFGGAEGELTVRRSGSPIVTTRVGPRDSRVIGLQMNGQGSRLLVEVLKQDFSSSFKLIEID